ncbi:MAG: alpha/beta fold hydrolase [Candidatus Kapaibacterium sp.]
MPYFNHDDIDLYYQKLGDGPPLMMIAGLASDSQSWLPVVEPLAERFTLILPDNRGCGRSRPQSAAMGIPTMAADCAALLGHLGIERAHVLGHSMGGYIAQQMALDFPDRCDRIVLAATSSYSSARNARLIPDWADYLESGMAPELWFRNVFYWIFSRQFFADEKLVADSVQYSVEYPYPQSLEAFRRQTSALAGFDLRNRIVGIRSRTLAICGREDILFPPEESIAAFEGIPHCDFSIIDGAAHSIHMEQPRAFIEKVVDFLEGQVWSK